MAATIFTLLAVVSAAYASEGIAQAFAPAPSPGSGVEHDVRLDQRIVPSPRHPTTFMDVVVEEGYTLLRDVAFPVPSNALLHRKPAESASACNSLCLLSNNTVWQSHGSVATAKCTLWRYCQDPDGCQSPASSPGKYSQLRRGDCELLSFPALDLGFSQSPHQVLGNESSAVNGSLLGTPSPSLLARGLHLACTVVRSRPPTVTPLKALEVAYVGPWQLS